MKIEKVKEQNGYSSNKEIKSKSKTKYSNNLNNRFATTTYFQSSQLISEINKNFISTHNKISFGSLYTSSKNILTNADIPSSCTEVVCHDIALTGSLVLKKIKSTAKDILLGLDDSIKGHVDLSDRVSVGIVDSNSMALSGQANVSEASCEESLIMSGYSKIEKAIARYLGLSDSAQIEHINCANVELNNSSRVNHVISDENLTIFGKGSVGDIECKGDKIFITGPIKIDGKIKFLDNGEVIILKNAKGESAIIDTDNIENGTAKYQIKAKGSQKNLIAKKIFANSLNQAISEIIEPDPKLILNEYKNVASILNLGKSTHPILTDISEAELLKAELLYNEFAQNTLLSLASPNKNKLFTTFWVKNKKLGNQNLTDFWLKSLGISIDAKTLEEKTHILNALPQKQKQKLIEITAKHWVNNVLPNEMSKIAKTNILGLQVGKTGENILELLKQGRAEDLHKILTIESIEKLETIKCGDKSLIDFWIDIVDGEGSAKLYSPRLKISRLKEIISSDDSIEKIYNATIKESKKISEQIQKTKEAYDNLINNSDLDDITKELLKEYQNNQLFSLIIAGNAKNSSVITHLELSTKSILEQLKFEREKAIKDSADDLFNPLRDHNYLSQNVDTPELESKINLVMTILKEKIQLSPATKSNEVKHDLANLSTCLREADGSTLSAWNKIVDQAQEYFENNQVNRVIDANIEQIYTVQKALKDNLPPEVKAAIVDKHLNPTQKEFIARYGNDNNLLNLLAQAAVKRDEDINGLIATEQMNNSVFDNLSYQFRKNISPETTKSMPEMADIYIKLLGIAPNKLSSIEKYKLLSKIPDEELELISESVKDYWDKNFLAKTMSDSILGKVRNFDAGYQSAQISQQLNNISVQIDGQQHTLSEISQNFDHFMGMYKENSAKNNYLLEKMAYKLDGIHADTSNIRTNIRAMLFQSIQSTQDPIMRAEMQELLQDADKMSLSKFINTVSEKQKIYKDNHKMNRLYGFVVQNVVKPAAMVGVAAAAIHFAPVAIPTLLGHGAVAGFFAHNITPIVTTAMMSLNSRAGMSMAMYSRFSHHGQVINSMT